MFKDSSATNDGGNVAKTELNKTDFQLSKHEGQFYSDNNFSKSWK